MFLQISNQALKRDHPTMRKRYNTILPWEPNPALGKAGRLVISV
jgi:hypothetical protein